MRPKLLGLAAFREVVRVPMKSQIVKRSVVVAGRKKSISLEEPVWRALKEIATYRDVTLVNSEDKGLVQRETFAVVFCNINITVAKNSAPMCLPV